MVYHSFICLWHKQLQLLVVLLVCEQFRKQKNLSLFRNKNMDCQRARFVLLHHTKKYISYGRSSQMAMPIIFIWDAKLYSIINEKSHLTIIKISHLESWNYYKCLCMYLKHQWQEVNIILEVVHLDKIISYASISNEYKSLFLWHLNRCKSIIY